MSGFSWSLFATIDVYYHAATVGLNPLQLVLVGTTLEVTVLLGEVPTGILADLYSRRLSIIIGYALFGIGVLIEGSFPAFAPILLGNVLWGLGICFISGAEEAWIADELGAEDGWTLQPVFLRGTQWKQTGQLLAIPVSIALASIAIQIPIVICGIANLLLALFLALAMPERGFQPAKRGERQPLRQLRAGLSLVRARYVLLLVMGITLSYGMYSEGFDRLWTKHLLDHFTLPAIGTLPIIIWWGILRGGSSLLAILLAGIHAAAPANGGQRARHLAPARHHYRHQPRHVLLRQHPLVGAGAASLYLHRGAAHALRPALLRLGQWLPKIGGCAPRSSRSSRNWTRSGKLPAAR